LAGASPAGLLARAAAIISATLGRPAAPGLGTGFEGAVGAAGVSAAGVSLEAGGAAGASPPPPSALRAAARISATDIFFLSAMAPATHQAPIKSATAAVPWPKIQSPTRFPKHCDFFHNVYPPNLPIPSGACQPLLAAGANRRRSPFRVAAPAARSSPTAPSLTADRWPGLLGKILTISGSFATPLNLVRCNF
jgi:hypothetical protein